MPLEMQGRSSDGYAMHWLSLGLYHALAMLWATFWALVLGFTISGVLQVFVGKEQISREFAQTNLKSVSFATGLGAASSSCSYAAVAAARSAMQQGAALIPALAFMFASTKLVIELGAVLWVLMTLVPHDWWEGLFLQTGSPVGRLIENALVGPIIAMISFVCSVGNIPLASLLWSHGISFGGVISFICADLIVIPIIIIYAKYYGPRRGLDYRNFLRLDGSCRNHRRSRFHPIRHESPGTASAGRGVGR